MKKKVIFSLFTLAVIASGSTVFALNSRSTPVSVTDTANHIAKSDVSAQATTPPVAQDTQTTTPPATPAAIAPTTQATATTPTQPTPDQNKAEIMGVITNHAQAYAQSTGVTDPTEVSNMTYLQTSCFDRYIFAPQNLYTDYSLLINNSTVQKYLSGQLLFTNGVCSTEVPPAN